MLPPTGEVMIRMLEDVQQVTIGPLIKQSIAEDSVVYMDEYDIFMPAVRMGVHASYGVSCRGGIRP
jgi:hypothetical protein